MKTLFSKILPGYVRYLRNVFPIYLYDMRRFYLHSSYASGHNDAFKLISKIIERYHSIEKGLTMPNFRPGFGEMQLLKLIDECYKYAVTFDKDHEQLRHAVGVINEYVERHNNIFFDLSEEIVVSFDRLKGLFTQIEINRQIEISRDDYFSNFDADFSKFALSRASIRNYTEEPVDIKEIIEAIKIAQSAPSACNRQSVKVYVYTNPDRIKKILEIQGGNRGFGHLANKLIVVTSDLGVWGFMGERYQSYVDGGIFAMSLLYGLHFKRIAACILNCSISPNKDRLLREVCNIRESENFIAMISCGYPPRNFMKAFSLRYETENILTMDPK